MQLRYFKYCYELVIYDIWKFSIGKVVQNMMININMIYNILTLLTFLCKENNKNSDGHAKIKQNFIYENYS